MYYQYSFDSVRSAPAGRSVCRDSIMVHGLGARLVDHCNNHINQLMLDVYLHASVGTCIDHGPGAGLVDQCACIIIAGRGLFPFRSQCVSAVLYLGNCILSF
jgi:hypothetical protein